MRLGDPAALSLPVTLLYLPYGLVGPLFIDPTRLGGSALQWLPVALAGQIVLMLVFWIGQRVSLTSALRGNHPLFNVLVMIVAVVTRAVVIAVVSAALGLSPSLELGYRIQTGLLGQTLTVIVLAIVVSAYSYHRRVAEDLSNQQSELDVLSTTMSARLADMNASINAEVHNSIDPLIQQLDDSLSRIASSTDVVRVRESIREIVDKELRPLSHRLATETESSTLERILPSETSAKIPISSHMRVKQLVTPSVIGLLVTALAGSQAARIFTFPDILVFPVVSGLLVFAYLGIAKFLIGGWKLRTWVGVALVTALVPLIVGLSYFTERGAGLPVPESIGVAGMVTAAILGFVTALYMVFTERLVSTEERLMNSVQEKLARMSILRQREYVARSQLSYVIHGSLQSTLYASAMRLAANSDPNHELIAEIRTDINTAVSKIDSGSTPYVLLIDTLADIAELWDGTCTVHWTIDYRTVRILVESPTAAISVAELARESVGNSVRHGAATEVWINISVSGGNVLMTAVDNGTGVPRDWRPGLGSRMLDELCVTWSRTPDQLGTRLVAEVATGLD